jgi:16S rRNA A1518/A1519 N6-dimethyltransferase RsmA/KsgA/DIM1 with predicted DNA glycosylase/AP lyase activity
VELSQTPNFEIGPHPEGFQAFLAQIFAARRKTIHNGLKAAGFQPEAALAALKLLELDPLMRAETIEPSRLGALYAQISTSVRKIP